jgi:glycine hydroxymethyltransferase
MNGSLFAEFVQRGAEILQDEDPALFALLEQEHQRQADTLVMVASSSIVDPSVLVCGSSIATNVTAEGYPGARFHAGCEVIDSIEQLAVERAKAVFGAQYANVQPHSGTTANQIAIFSLLKPGDTLLGLGLDAGGHLTHGAKASVSGRYFNAIGYGLDADGWIDYDQVERLAHEHHPRLIICGASAYPRTVDFRRFREIADAVGAYLLADISHIAGLVAAGQHPSPIDHAHITTTSTYKQLYGPRGGLILMGKDHAALAPDGKRALDAVIQQAVFPFFQGTPDLSAIAAKARAFAMLQTAAFGELARSIVDNARTLAEGFCARGYKVLTGGTDNHIVLIDVSQRGLTGLIVEQALESCNIIVNKNKIAGDTKNPRVTSGVRFGTNSLSARGMGHAEMLQCVALVDTVLASLRPLNDWEYVLDPAVRAAVQAEVADLCQRFVLPRYQLKARAANA